MAEGTPKVGERVDLELDRAARVDPGKVAIRIDGMHGDQERAAVHRRVAETLGRAWDVVSAGTGVSRAEEGVQVGLTGPFADPQRQGRMREAVRAAVVEGVDTVSADVCVCASGVPGDEIPLAPPFPWWDAAGAFIPPPDGGPDWVIAVFLDSPGWNRARLILRSGATADPPVSKHEVVVGLGNGTWWAKEIWAMNLCSGRIASVYQEDTSSTLHRMRLEEAGCWAGADTIVFRKPGFFGIWHDVGHFPPETFWQAFGGTVAEFT